ncbi:MAG: hypothetical protein WC485_01680 [Opitutaceae bacterium]
MTAAVQKLAKTIETLPPKEQAELFAWLDARRAREWDAGIRADSAGGRLDHLIEEAQADYHAGRCRPLDDLVNDQS